MNKSTPLSQLPSQQPGAAVVQQPLNDDDVVVQDILNQINGGGGGGSITPESMMMMEQPQQYHPPPPQYYAPPPPQQPPPPPQMMVQPQEIQNYMLYFADDLKLAGLVFTITILVHFIPIDKYVSKYFNIQNIPYHEIILRAIMIALFVVLIKKFAKI
jgi:hypothetical protein